MFANPCCPMAAPGSGLMALSLLCAGASTPVPRHRRRSPIQIRTALIGDKAGLAAAGEYFGRIEDSVEEFALMLWRETRVVIGKNSVLLRWNRQRRAQNFGRFRVE